MLASHDNHMTSEVAHVHRQFHHVTGDSLRQYLNTLHKGLRTAPGKEGIQGERRNGSRTPNWPPYLPLVEHGLATRVNMGRKVGDSGCW